MCCCKILLYTWEVIEIYNATLISFVPKVNCPKLVGEYRLITCCNIIYKAITKVITTRLYSVMGSLTDEIQGVFVRGRSIADNIPVCQGMVRGYHKDRGSLRCFLKLDMRKAYDTLDWSFIEAVLFGLNFPRHFINLMMTCISTPKFSIMINGSPCGFLLAKKE